MTVVATALGVYEVANRAPDPMEPWAEAKPNPRAKRSPSSGGGTPKIK